MGKNKRKVVDRGCLRYGEVVGKEEEYKLWKTGKITKTEQTQSLSYFALHPIPPSPPFSPSLSLFPAALGHYARVNGCLPERVLVYRDGVGDGQLNYVRDTEVAAIRVNTELLKSI